MTPQVIYFWISLARRALVAAATVAAIMAEDAKARAAGPRDSILFPAARPKQESKLSIAGRPVKRRQVEPY